MTVFVIVISSAVIFTLVYFVPGDPARVMLGAAADEDEIARSVSYTHLDVYKRQGLHSKQSFRRIQ